MTILYYTHMLTGIITLALFFLVGIGFGPHLKLHGQDKQSRMGMFIASVSFYVWARTLWWSVLRPLAGDIGWMREVNYGLNTLLMNTAFNGIGIFAALCALAALHVSLPPAARKTHNWLNAPFYPERFSILWRL